MQFELGFQPPKKKTEKAPMELEEIAVRDNLSVTVGFKGKYGPETMRLDADKQQSLSDKLEFWRKQYPDLQVVKIKDGDKGLRKAA
jgi:hypothetical protein